MNGYTIREYNKISTWHTITEFSFIAHTDVLDVLATTNNKLI